MRGGQERSFWRATDSDQHRSQSIGGTSTDGFTRLGWTDRILTTRSGDDYLDIANTYLSITAAGADIDSAAAVVPVNNWLHSLFSQVDVYLNGTLVTPLSNTYAYRAYIKKLLNYGIEAKKSQLSR